MVILGYFGPKIYKMRAFSIGPSFFESNGIILPHRKIADFRFLDKIMLRDPLFQLTPKIWVGSNDTV